MKDQLLKEKLDDILIMKLVNDKAQREEIIASILELVEKPLSRNEFVDIFLRLGKRVPIDDEENKGHFRWAWIIDYDELFTALNKEK